MNLFVCNYYNYYKLGQIFGDIYLNFPSENLRKIFDWIKDFPKKRSSIYQRFSEGIFCFAKSLNILKWPPLDFIYYNHRYRVLIRIKRLYWI